MEKKVNFNDLSLNEAVQKCGELRVSIEDTVALLSDKMEAEKLRSELMTEGSQLYNIYLKGITLNKVDIKENLLNLIGDPKAKGAYENFTSERTREAVNRKIEENFGIKIDG